MSPFGVLVLLTLVVLTVWVGAVTLRFGAPLRLGLPATLEQLVSSGLVGATVVYGFLAVLSLAGLRWSLPVLAGSCFLMGLLTWWLWRRRERAATSDATVEPGVGFGVSLPADRFGWGDGLAAVVVGIFLVLAGLEWATTPDFVYHWGAKGARFALAQGLDWEYLQRAANWAVHPDYPNLLPTFYALHAQLRGQFEAGTLAASTGLVVAATVIAGRVALAALEVSGGRLQLAVAVLSTVTAMVAIGQLLAGGADLLVALALVAGLSALIGRDNTPEGRMLAAWQLGWIAAFAAGAKVEGMVVGGLLVGAGLLERAMRSWREWRAGIAPRVLVRRQLGEVVRLVGPFAAVVAIWAVGVAKYGLLMPYNSGPFDLAHLPVVVTAAGQVLADQRFHGVGWVVLAAPLLVVVPRLRWRLQCGAALVGAMLCFDLYVYLCSAVDTRLWVLTSLPRLLCQLLPLSVVVMAAALVGGQKPTAVAAVTPRRAGDVVASSDAQPSA